MHHDRQKRGGYAGILLPMGLVCLFAFCSLALALYGGQAYKKLQAAVDDGYDSTVAASYLRTKLLAADAVELRDEAGTDVLVLLNSHEDVVYETRIFFTADGRLLETQETAGTPFNAIGGMQIALLERCSFELAGDGLFSAEVVSPAGTVARVAYCVAEGGAL